MAYYNEFDGFAAQWLRNLVDSDHISKGVVDDRSILDVRANEISGYKRCHFFAGIGGWELALQLAGWPDSAPVWTGSCPCQPFSAANQEGTGMDDERHLWPAMFNLIRDCQPPTVFGEQVADAIKDGWLDRVFDDLEGIGYACGAAVLPACSVKAPHLRKRLFWVAHSNHSGQPANKGQGQEGNDAWGSRQDSGMANPQAAEVRTRFSEVQAGSISQDPIGFGNGITLDAWNDWELVERFDPGGTVRARVESGVFPMAPRVPEHVGLIRAYGNAIVPQVAAEFISAFMEVA